MQTIDVSAVARSLVVRLHLPDATPVFGPDPDNNEWKMLAVGYPVWLWTEGPRQKSASRPVKLSDAATTSILRSSSRTRSA